MLKLSATSRLAQARRGLVSWPTLGLVAALLLSSLLGMFSPVQAAGVKFVSNCGTYDSSQGLGEAISDAASGDTILFLCSGSIIIPATINITNTLTFDAGGSSVTLDGNNSVRVFNVVITTGNLTLNHLTISRGKAPGTCGGNVGCGGAIYNAGTLSVTNSTFSSNSAYYGGAINNDVGGISSIINSTFSSNSSATFGGAIANINTISSIINSTFSSNSAYDGSAIYNNASATISSIINSTFSSNSAQYGGAIVNTGSLSSLTNSTFSSNSATNGNGGAIYNSSGGNISTISNSSFTTNSANGDGGAIYNVGSLGTISNSSFSTNSTQFSGGAINNGGNLNSLTSSTFSSNSATFGGAINNAGSLSSLTNSTFSSNSAIGGGAIRNDSSLSSLTNSTFSSNSATYGGGAIRNDSSISLSNSTFSSNSATINGGAINNEFGGGGGPSVIKNSLFAKGISGSNCYKLATTFTDGGYNLSDDATCFGTGTSQTNVATLNLGPLQNNGGPTQTIALLTGSAALSFVATGCPATDQRDTPRPATFCDAGAYQHAASVICIANQVSKTTDDASCGTLRYALSKAIAGNTIVFSFTGPTTITISNGSLNVPQGVNLNTNGTAVTLDGAGSAGDGLVLNSNSTVTGLSVKGFARRQIVIASGGRGNHLVGVKTSRT